MTTCRRVQRNSFYRCSDERQRRRKKVDASYAAITAISLERVVKGRKFTMQNSVGGFLNRRFKLSFWGAIRALPVADEAR